MKRLFAAVALVAAFFVTACAGNLPGVSQQGKAGVTDWEVSFNEETGQVEHARIIDGKEKADVAFKVDLKAGTATYSAKEVKAFDGQAFRAELEKVLAQEYGGAAPGVIDSIIKLIKGGG